ncbi:MAG: hypothetical protein M3321_03480 [Actinomycetota bacterium]|nr:hypothetical protein [Actinomycetota bacterium]
MVRISDRVWERWAETSAEFDEPAIVLLFASERPRAQVLAALQQAAGDAIRELDPGPDPGPGVDEFRTGYVSFAPVREGVAVRIDEEPDDFEGLVRRIASGLEARGLEGALDVYERETVEVPEFVDLLECRLRVAGDRFHYRGPNWGWRAEPDALDAAVDAGVRWCLANGPALPLSLAVSLVTPSPLGPDDDVRAYVRQALELTAELGVVRLTSAGPDRFRTLAVDRSKGRVSLIEGGATIPASGWEPSVRGLRKRLAEAAPWAVYGFVKRGSRRESAVHGGSLADDWVPVPHFLVGSYIADPFEDEYAPDAFALQLLGEGYAGRVPGEPDWQETPAGSRAVLVEHAAPEEWFDGRLVPFGGYRSTPSPDEVPIPNLVTRARADFAEILFRDDIAWGR